MLSLSTSSPAYDVYHQYGNNHPCTMWSSLSWLPLSVYLYNAIIIVIGIIIIRNLPGPVRDKVHHIKPRHASWIFAPCPGTRWNGESCLSENETHSTGLDCKLDWIGNLVGLWTRNDPFQWIVNLKWFPLLWIVNFIQARKLWDAQAEKPTSSKVEKH